MFRRHETFFDSIVAVTFVECKRSEIAGPSAAAPLFVAASAFAQAIAVWESLLFLLPLTSSYLLGNL